MNDSTHPAQLVDAALAAYLRAKQVANDYHPYTASTSGQHQLPTPSALLLRSVAALRSGSSDVDTHAVASACNQLIEQIDRAGTTIGVHDLGVMEAAVALARLVGGPDAADLPGSPDQRCRHPSVPGRSDIRGPGS